VDVRQAREGEREDQGVKILQGLAHILRTSRSPQAPPPGRRLARFVPPGTPGDPSEKQGLWQRR